MTGFQKIPDLSSIPIKELRVNIWGSTFQFQRTGKGKSGYISPNLDTLVTLYAKMFLNYEARDAVLQLLSLITTLWHKLATSLVYPQQTNHKKSLGYNNPIVFLKPGNPQKPPKFQCFFCCWFFFRFNPGMDFTAFTSHFFRSLSTFVGILESKNKTGWWLNQPLWKICSSKWVHLPQGSGWK